MAVSLGIVCRQAREAAGLYAIHIANAASVTQSVISKFEAGQGWRRKTEEIVGAYERECGLNPGELWHRAADAIYARRS